MKIKTGKSLKLNCVSGTNSLIPIIFLLIILCGQSYAQWDKTTFPDTVKVNNIVTKDSYIFVGTEGDGIFVSTNNGENWTSNNEGLQSKLIHAILITGQTRIFAGTEKGVSVSTDMGENWRPINSGLYGLGVWSLAVSVNTSGDTTIFAGTWSGLYSSTDRGESWEATGLSTTTTPVNSIIIDKNIICAATFSNGIFLSDNNGLTWKNIDVKTRASIENDLIPKSAPVYSISLFANPLNNRLLVGSIGGLYYTVLGDTIFYDDTSFVKIYKQEAPVLCFAGRNDTLFTSAGGNFYKLFWTYIYIHHHTYPGYPDLIDSILAYDARRLNTPYLGNQTVYSLALNNEYIFAGTKDGIRRLRYPEAITRVASFQEVPAGFVLEQNYPNPFNPTTTIKYNIPKAAHVTLKVYDILGNVVKTLVNKEQQPGSYGVQFVAGGSQPASRTGRLASGIYFYRLQAGSFVRTKKMILLQ